MQGRTFRYQPWFSRGTCRHLSDEMPPRNEPNLSHCDVGDTWYSGEVVLALEGAWSWSSRPANERNYSRYGSWPHAWPASFFENPVIHVVPSPTLLPSLLTGKTSVCRYHLNKLAKCFVHPMVFGSINADQLPFRCIFTSPYRFVTVFVLFCIWFIILVALIKQSQASKCSVI